MRNSTHNKLLKYDCLHAGYDKGLNESRKQGILLSDCMQM